jgi:hypothetical protein
MSTVLGILGIADTDRKRLQTVGERTVYDALQQVLGDHNDEMEQMEEVFIQGETEDYSIRYRLPGNGYLQKDYSGGGEANAHSRQAAGYWDVGLPLEQWGDAVNATRVAFAYMSVQEFSLHIDTVMEADKNTMRREILVALFRNTQRTFQDPIHGAINVEPLANNDSVLYPPVIGTTSEAQRQRYNVSGYIAADIDDTNNPYRTIVQRMEADFGKVTGGSNIATFINSAQVAVTEDLTDFVAVESNFVISGDNITLPTGLPERTPGRVIGHTNGTWVIEWDWVPANYMFSEHLGAPKPLLKRVDPADTGLPRGLSLVAEDEVNPIQNSEWNNRYGVGVANRLNGHIMQFKASGSYDIPTVG